MRKNSRVSWNHPQHIQCGVSFIPVKLLFIPVYIHFRHVYKQTPTHKAEKSWCPAIWCPIMRLKRLGSFQARLSCHEYLLFLLQWLCSPTPRKPKQYCTAARLLSAQPVHLGSWAEANCFFLRRCFQAVISPHKKNAQISIINEVLLTLLLKLSVDVSFPCCHPEIHITISVFHGTVDTIGT